ncbi:MarR family winged helix-turn-helix transcriptional regulator [Ectobacillus ponti]|uniref:MarR family transcriptional regulator n=1 Tax=Ectobacillus ponti TaxID=2961894 RepID=A0AA41X0Z1_9BACI|nr:MarR family transcriptional regulator [Ectobacillus ponti]MCP8966951.1 MarR family transcriptional regulator [Ectobacillus ponti]
MEDRDVLIGQIGLRFRKIGRMLQEEVNEAFRSYMAWNEFEVLRMLHQRGPQTATELACELRVSPSHITAVGDMLVKGEYVKRYRSNKDRRLVFMEATEKGKEVSDILEAKRADYIRNKYQIYTTAELVMLLGLLNRLF